MAKLAATDQAQFIKISKLNQVTDFGNFTGYNISAPVFLESGRLLDDTLRWNPLTFALVFDHT